MKWYIVFITFFYKCTYWLDMLYRAVFFVKTCLPRLADNRRIYLKWSWEGHVARQEDDRCTKRIVYHVNEGKKDQQNVARWHWSWSWKILSPVDSRSNKLKNSRGGLCPAMDTNRLLQKKKKKTENGCKCIFRKNSWLWNINLSIRMQISTDILNLQIFENDLSFDRQKVFSFGILLLIAIFV